MGKYKILLAHEDINTRNKIKASLEKIDNIEIIGITDNGIDTYNMIVDKKPDIVFMEYYFKNMNGFDIVKKTKDALNDNSPLYNFIENGIPQEELKKALQIENHKINAFVIEPYDLRTKEIIDVYKEING